MDVLKTYKIQIWEDIPTINDRPLRRVESQKNRHRTMDASQTTTSRTKTIRA